MTDDTKSTPESWPKAGTKEFNAMVLERIERDLKELEPAIRQYVRLLTAQDTFRALLGMEPLIPRRINKRRSRVTNH